jgi:hypothetical protein
MAAELPASPLGRKPWYRSWKVRCAWVATSFPLAATAYWAWSGTLVPIALIYAMMTPWLLLGGGEQGADLVKLHHEGKSGAA